MEVLQPLGAPMTRTFMLQHFIGMTVATPACREWVLLNRVRGQDVQLMKKLDVSLICDLMVEKKKLKYGLL